MASPAASEALLPPFLAFRLRLPTSSSAASAGRSRSAAALLIIAAFLIAICAVSGADMRPSADADALRSEIEDLRLNVARLESMLEENTHILKSKSIILEEDSKLIEAMEHDIQLLMDGEESTKKSQSKSYPESKIKSLEDEVQILQEETRKINNIASTIESLANDAEKRVASLSLEVKKIEDIIAEQWIQIRQFEQAFVLTKMMTSKVHERRSSENAYQSPGKESRDIFLKYVRSVDFYGMFLAGTTYARSCFSHTYERCRSFIQSMNRCIHEATRFCKAIRRRRTPDIDKPNVFFLGGSISRSSISLPYSQLKIFMSSAQKFHHKVQVLLQNAMRSNRYSRGLSNELITFCLAYLVVISPMWMVWLLYSMRFGSKN